MNAIGINKLKRGRYEWPRVTVIHAEYGSFLMDIHGMGFDDGAIVLVTFLNKPINKMLDLLHGVSKNMSKPIISLDESDISEDIAVRLAARFAANQGADVAVMQVCRPSRHECRGNAS